MFEPLVLGAAQGVAEWLPVSSEGLIVLLKNAFFGGGEFLDIVRFALFLHLGTFLAALVYFRHDVAVLLREALRYQDAAEDRRRTLNFLAVSTLLSGAVGFTLLQWANGLTERFELSGRGITAMIGVLLLATGWLQLAGRKGARRKQPSDLRAADGVLLGLAQGAAALPGLSRSGLTVSALLLLGYDDESALRLSFLMSLPIVLAGNILLNLGGVSLFNGPGLLGLAAAFVFGLLTIGLLMRAARKANFGAFVLGFGLLTIASVLV